MGPWGRNSQQHQPSDSTVQAIATVVPLLYFIAALLDCSVLAFAGVLVTPTVLVRATLR